MRASLPQREPEILKRWQENNLYEKLMLKNEDKPLFILHDGPPYANGDLHVGHILNKTLKDIIVRYKNMAGFKAPYIHGWDTHGLPIERQAIKKLGIDRHEAGPVRFRAACKEFALSYVENQKAQLKRLGALGDYENSYLTLAPEFEAKQVLVFGKMAEKGYIYKGLKPVYWCPDCETALAEAEIEYDLSVARSIYVKFRVSDDKGLFSGLEIPKENIYFVIWTTTTWTLPGNMAICLNADFEYSLVRAGGEAYVIASELLKETLEAAGIEEYAVLKKFKGAELEHIVCEHPFIERKSVVILGEHVTLEAGTGCVHTAPGHGIEDFEVCAKYKIPVIVPVDAKGYLNADAGKFAGLFYKESGAAIEKELKESGALLAAVELEHQYPHCWRCSSPIVFRATEQWFASIDGFKSEALEAISKVKWYPAWGEERIQSMVRDRNDWCISRQRIWGVPIPIFYCKSCGKELINNETVLAVSKLFGEKGSDAWFYTDAADILPKGAVCVCGCGEFTKETDIMDVWFDSGTSHAGVLETKKGLRWPADLYLEGHDQYRGWFQSSLLTSVATKGAAPYKSVVTHGFVMDDEARKMSKSKGNVIAPMDIINEYGADILRLWSVSADYKSDVRISKDILKQMSEVYRKIRNTARFILGNIGDFDPGADALKPEELYEIDQWALARLDRLVKGVMAAYENYDFHLIYHAIHNFCVVDMSNFYLDIIKDRLYAERAKSRGRRAAQTAMYLVLDALVKLAAPILAYTSEEIWQFMPHKSGDEREFAALNELPKAAPGLWNEGLDKKWESIREIRAEVSKALENARSEKTIGHSLGAKVSIYAAGEAYRVLKEMEGELDTIFIVSIVSLYEEDRGGVLVEVSAAPGEKCERCWLFRESVGKDEEHKTLCERCAGVLKG